MAFDAARLMLSAGVAAEADLQRAREIQAARGGSLPRICVDLGILDEGRWVRLVAKALSLPTVDLDTVLIEPAARRKAPDLLLRELAALPYQLREDGRVLGVAMAEPQDDVAKAQLRAATGCELEISVAGYSAVEKALTDRDESAAGAPPVTNLRRDSGKEWSSPAEGGLGDNNRFGPGVVDLTPEHARILETLSQAAARSAIALRAAVDLCVERRLFTPDDLKARMGRKP
jgi:hypothetical protein